MVRFLVKKMLKKLLYFCIIKGEEDCFLLRWFFITLVTGEGMPSWVHGRVYPVIQIRTRNGVTQLLLGDINSWIRLPDVTRETGTPPPPPPPPPPIRVGDRVRVNQGIRTWATGEGMPSWVHGRIYPVIEIRTRSGVTQLLLGAGINSWIRQADVTRV